MLFIWFCSHKTLFKTNLKHILKYTSISLLCVVLHIYTHIYTYAYSQGVNSGSLWTQSRKYSGRFEVKAISTHPCNELLRRTHRSSRRPRCRAGTSGCICWCRCSWWNSGCTWNLLPQDLEDRWKISYIYFFTHNKAKKVLHLVSFLKLRATHCVSVHFADFRALSSLHSWELKSSRND